MSSRCVDDALFAQSAQALGLNACLLLSFCQVFGFPISWQKVQFGPSVEFIGWELHFRSGSLLPANKVRKLLDAICKVLDSTPCHWRDLESLIGLLHWVLQLAPELKPWLCSLYQDKDRPAAANMSMSHATWQQLSSHLHADCAFKSVPPGAAIRVGARLLSVRHVDISSLSDLRKVRISSKRVWARVADPTTSKRSLCAASKNFLSYWKGWRLRPQIHRPLGAPSFSVDVELAADACAHGSRVGLGGWIAFPSQPVIWFAETFTTQDFQKRDVPVKDSANLDVVCYETLAQVALLACFAAACRGGRLRIKIPSWSDNSGTGSRLARLALSDSTGRFPHCRLP